MSFLAEHKILLLILVIALAWYVYHYVAGNG